MLEDVIPKPDVVNAIAAAASSIAAVAACVIAYYSFRVSRRTFVNQHIHNLTSVRPLASIEVGDFENRLYVKLVNNGVGPLIVKSIRVPGGLDPDQPLYLQMPNLGGKVFWTNFVEDTAGRSIRPGAELMLLDLDAESSTSKTQYVVERDNIRRALGTLSIDVAYTDIYDTDFPLASRSLNWLHRHL